MEPNKWRYNKKIHIWKKVKLSLRGKKILINQILFSKLWYMGQIYTISKRKLKIEYTVFPGTGKNTKSQTPSSNLYLKRLTRYFRHRNTIELYKTKMDSKVIKPHKCSLERTHAVLIEINYKFWSRPSPF